MRGRVAPPVKHYWVTDLPSAARRRRAGACVGLKLRAPAAGARVPLAQLMLEGYRGTIDDEGEDLAAALVVVDAFFAKARPDADGSVVAWSGEAPVGACLVEADPHHPGPFIAEIFTAPDWKRKGVARLCLVECMRRLTRAGHPRVGAYITEGNAPSEALFSGLFFHREGR